MIRSILFPGLMALMYACGPLEVYRNPSDVPDDDTADDDTGTPPATDADNDGYTDESDCDDNDASVGPATAWYLDGDGDGWGLDGSIQYACAQLDGYAPQGGDCNDANSAINPDGVEICDELDNDCSGMPDDVEDNVWYLDSDLDGYGSGIGVVDGCEIESVGDGQWVDNAGDCDDTDASVNTDAEEVCDSLDNDCDGQIDVDAIDAATWYEDLDGDDQGSDVTESACEPSEGFVTETGDCEDNDPRVFTGATEVCDELDNDCDSTTDESDGNPDVLVLWDDDDGDGHGDNAGSFIACPADGFVEQGGDCDDTDASVNPGATEICDGVDNDCDGSTDPDDSADASTWYGDVDSDGYGDSSNSSTSCSAPSGTVSDATDCDDTNLAVNPGATEVCNTLDDDCDGSIDPSTSADAGTWYLDADSDSYGDASASFVSCESPVGYTADATDCDDGDATSYPGASEVCDGADNDCDGSTDPDSSADATTWYDDTDGDGWGDASASSVSCSAPSGSVSNSTDCDDSDSSVYPGATEYCDEQDNDCDGDVDEDVGATFYADTDGDGYGDPAVSADACSVTSGYSANAEDCDDTDASVNPGATEICDSVDNDCDGSTDPDSSVDASTWYSDSDSDGYGDGSASTTSCSAPSGTVPDGTDCDDATASANPGAAEVCDGADNDCDGNVDTDAVDETTWYPDFDSDAYGNASGVTVTQCQQPSSYVSDATDCDDGDATSYPGASEVCDGADNDCDGVTDPDSSVDASEWYADVDTDGFGDAASSSTSCSAPEGTVSDATDCDDEDEYVNPDAIEVCGDTADNDCDEDTDSSPCVTEGSYTGTFAIELTETTYGLGSDSCEGTASLAVDTTASPMISGTVACQFVGDAASYLSGTYVGTVEGDFAQDISNFGTVDFTTFGWRVDFAGVWDADHEVNLDFEGSDTYEVYGILFDFTYEGYVDTDVVP